MGTPLRVPPPRTPVQQASVSLHPTLVRMEAVVNFARNTIVTEGETRAEIKRLLDVHEVVWSAVGANISHDGVVKCRACERLGSREVRILVHMPESGRERNRLWRVVLLLLKAKLEAVSSGVSTFDAEFLAFIALPGGQTAGQFMAPKIKQAYQLQR